MHGFEAPRIPPRVVSLNYRLARPETSKTNRPPLVYPLVLAPNLSGFPIPLSEIQLRLARAAAV
jgi:hypothetical protein